MKKIVLSLFACVVLVACDKANNGNGSITNQMENALTKPQHYHVLQDGYQFGYERQLSQELANTGQAAAPLVMLRYLGEQDGKHQIVETEGATDLVMECANPCKFIKIMGFVGGEFAEKQHLKYVPGIVAYYAFEDAFNGQLKQFVYEKSGKQVHLWFDEQKGMIKKPVPKQTLDKPTK